VSQGNRRKVGEYEVLNEVRETLVITKKSGKIEALLEKKNIISPYIQENIFEKGRK